MFFLIRRATPSAARPPAGPPICSRKRTCLYMLGGQRPPDLDPPTAEIPIRQRRFDRAKRARRPAADSRKRDHLPLKRPPGGLTAPPSPHNSRAQPGVMGRTKGPRAGKKHARRSGRSRRRFSLELEECERVSCSLTALRGGARPEYSRRPSGCCCEPTGERVKSAERAWKLRL